MMLVGERILPKRLDEIKPNHRARYEWAAHFCKPGMGVVDVAAGVGYGSYILASKGCDVFALDGEPEAEPFQKRFWSHPRVQFQVGDAYDITQWDFGIHVGVIVSLETIEHMEHVESFMREISVIGDNCTRLVASVPNQDIVPFSKETHKFHYRHYTKEEFTELLEGHDWKPTSWWTQYGKWEKFQMIPGTGGMTLGVVCERL